MLAWIFGIYCIPSSRSFKNEYASAIKVISEELTSLQPRSLPITAELIIDPDQNHVFFRIRQALVAVIRSLFNRRWSFSSYRISFEVINFREIAVVQNVGDVLQLWLINRVNCADAPKLSKLIRLLSVTESTVTHSITLFPRFIFATSCSQAWMYQ